MTILLLLIVMSQVKDERHRRDGWSSLGHGYVTCNSVLPYHLPAYNLARPIIVKSSAKQLVPVAAVPLIGKYLSDSASHIRSIVKSQCIGPQHLLIHLLIVRNHTVPSP